MKNIFLILFLSIIFHFVHAQDEKNQQKVEVFADWVLACATENSCIGNQTIKTDKGAIVSAVNVTKISNNTLVEFALPLMMNLRKKVVIEIDDSFASSFLFDTCTLNGCIAIIYNNEEILEAFKKGITMKVTAETIDRRKLELTFSLKGFSKVFSRL